jgi:hypothetical protein
MLQIDWPFVARLGIGVLAVFSLGLAWPSLIYEDGLIESTSALWFATASFFGLLLLISPRGPRSETERLFLMGATVLSLLCFLSEISFGARLLNFGMPKMPGGGEFDGGQDIVILCFKLLQHASIPTLVLALIGLALMGAAAGDLAYRYRQSLKAFVLKVIDSKFLFRLAVAVGLLALAVVLDLVPSFKASVLEETFEFFSGLVLIGAMHAVWQAGKSSSPEAAALPG